MFWDSSALVPLLLPETRSGALTSLLRSDPEPALWWSSSVECQSAIYRTLRDGRVPTRLIQTALDRLEILVATTDTVAPSDELRRRAGRLLAVHPLRAADSLQLAAALLWCEDHPRGERFVCLDTRLRDAALHEGFALVP